MSHSGFASLWLLGFLLRMLALARLSCWRPWRVSPKLAFTTQINKLTDFRWSLACLNLKFARLDGAYNFLRRFATTCPAGSRSRPGGRVAGALALGASRLDYSIIVTPALLHRKAI